VSPELQRWTRLIGESPGQLHRKIWEWCFICEAMSRHGALQPGKRGLGFAVGTEPLASRFASLGAEIVATDLDTRVAAEHGWVASAQHANNKALLNARGLCPAADFEQRVSFEFADMNAIPAKYAGGFDFAWSSCAFEHLGSIEHGLAFVVASMECLKPGGIAVHTTEFNVSSNDETLESGPTVLYRRRDIEGLLGRLRSLSYQVEMDWDTGDAPQDLHVDVPPYNHGVHLKLQISRYTATSIGLVIVKP
jgi:hypothetical protein